MKFIRIVFAAGLIFYSPQANAQYNFNASSIPDSLKRNANAVYVLDEGILEVKAPGVYTLQTHQIITVLNREGLAHLTQSFFTDKFNSVEEVQIKIYDSIGNEIKKYKKKDFITQAYADESTLAKAKITEPYGYILKPFKEIDLHSTIEMALYKHKKDTEVQKERDFLYSLVENKDEEMSFLFMRR